MNPLSGRFTARCPFSPTIYRRAWLREWLRANIHAHGRKFTPAALVQRVTGGEMSAALYLAYLNGKHRDLWAVETYVAKADAELHLWSNLLQFGRTMQTLGNSKSRDQSGAAEKILVIDDDEYLLRLIERVLQGYSVFTATNGEEGLACFRQIAPDLVILDVMMPGLDGWEVCRRLRQISAVPIIFLTALGAEKHVVDGLMDGADDYLVKPFRPDELRARVSALLRRARMPHESLSVLRFGDGDLIINRTEQIVFAYGKEVPLSPIEYNLLLFMAQRAGQILPAETLHDAIWGSLAATGTESLKWYIWRLRQKVEADPQNPRFILTERGKGYRFSPQ